MDVGDFQMGPETYGEPLVIQSSSQHDINDISIISLLDIQNIYIYIIYLSLLYTYIYIYTYPYYRSLPKFSIPNEMKPLEACGDAGQTAAGAYLHQYFGVAQLLRILAGDRYAASCQLPPVVQFGPVPSQP